MSDDKAIDNLDSGSQQDILQAKLTLETASISWRELQRFFAAGKAIAVDSDLDLVEVAAALANDDRTTFEQWTDQKKVAPVTDEQAAEWFEANATMWAVVVAPWVLVQLRLEPPKQ